MKIPKQLNILGHSYAVILRNRTNQDGQSAYGTHNLAVSKIWIDKDISQSQQESTLIHEIIEAVNSMNDLELAHKQISTLEVGIYQVLSDNNLLK